jgi:hypothetical protein
MQGLGVNLKDFVEQVLKSRGLTLYEFKEDVIKLGLLMEKLCKSNVVVKEEEIQQAFQAELSAHNRQDDSRSDHDELHK